MNGGHWSAQSDALCATVLSAHSVASLKSPHLCAATAPGLARRVAMRAASLSAPRRNCLFSLLQSRSGRNGAGVFGWLEQAWEMPTARPVRHRSHRRTAFLLALHRRAALKGPPAGPWCCCGRTRRHLFFAPISWSPHTSLQHNTLTSVGARGICAAMPSAVNCLGNGWAWAREPGNTKNSTLRDAPPRVGDAGICSSFAA